MLSNAQGLQTECGSSTHIVSSIRCCSSCSPSLQLLAEWIGKNMHDKLGFSDKQDPAKWSVSELNDILHKHVDPDRNGCQCALHTSDAWNGSPSGEEVMQGRCYPFNMPKRQFHNADPEIYHNIDIPYSS